MQTDNLKKTQSELSGKLRTQNLKCSPSEPGIIIYRKIIRLNLFTFIDCCFREAPLWCKNNQWGKAKEHFFNNGKSISPYFQDIPGEFLNFCQKHFLLDPVVLAFMDFEYTQQMAEIITTPPIENYWDKNSIMYLSPSAFLRKYYFDFLNDTNKSSIIQPVNILIWRDYKFDVFYKKLSLPEKYLLEYIKEQPLSLKQLKKLLLNQSELIDIIHETWSSLANKSVIIPESTRNNINDIISIP
ncbi:TPA: putative DNA-binding domain-containing protein [Salmonella enterica]|nr:putative DNA-binding domain-containing protein [Salmonella enterica]